MVLFAGYFCLVSCRKIKSVYCHDDNRPILIRDGDIITLQKTFGRILSPLIKICP